MTTLREVLRQTQPHTPDDLPTRILLSLERARMRRLTIQLALVLLGLVACIIYSVLNRAFLSNSVSGSSFIDFLRLAWTDPDIAWAFAGDFATGLLETIPLTFVVVTLAIGCGSAFAMKLGDGLRHLKQSRRMLTTTGA